MKLAALWLGIGSIDCGGDRRPTGTCKKSLFNQKLMIGAPREEVLAHAMRSLERQLGREINYTVLTPKEFESRRARKDAFLENVWHSKRVSLIGRDEEPKVAHR